MRINRHCHSPGIYLIAGALLLGGCVAPPATTSSVPVAIAPLFGDHAVLQAGMPVPVWGVAGPGESVTVTFRGETASAVADKDGRWTATLAPLKASSEPADLVVAGQTTATSHDVLVGEVWLCSGQSNMEFTVDDGGPTYQVKDAEAEVASANDPAIRQFKVERAVAASPAKTVKTDGWKAASPQTVGHFTAVGYFFARDIHRATGEPVGILLTSWGGTPIESWLSESARASTTVAAAIDARWAKSKSAWPPERVARYPADRKAWEKAEAEAHANHTRNKLPWPSPPAGDDSPWRPSGLYNGMIAPLEPAALRGFIWYQGESNVAHASEYAELMKTLITSWRSAWGGGNIPFYFVQLANYSSDGEENHRDWAMLREAQAQALVLPATGMAVAIDIGEAHNIHPKNKQELARRLALFARAQVYSLPPETSGPVFAGVVREGPALRVRFIHAGGELKAQGGPITAVEVAGADKLFHAASATIEGDTLVASSPDVPEPVAVRYAWTNAPVANLYNDAGLPAVPFRSDSW